MRGDMAKVFPKVQIDFKAEKDNDAYFMFRIIILNLSMCDGRSAQKTCTKKVLPKTFDTKLVFPTFSKV